MVFSSVVFLFYFLSPVLLLAFFARGTAGMNAVLIIASLAFYVYGEAQHTLVLLAVIAAAYAYSRAASAGRETVPERTALLVAVVATLGLLGYFKYAEFMRSSLAPFLPFLERLDFRDVHLPLASHSSSFTPSPT
jgi:alginate O-acetyltransferase complex protein AlgI